MSQFKDTDLINKVSLLLKTLRVEKNLSQEVVFFDTGIHIGRIELGKQNISLSTLSVLCQYFDISLIDFFIRLDKVK